MTQGEIVELYDWEYDWAVHVGTQRQEANQGRKDAHYYQRERMQDDLRGHIAACVAEIAVARHANRYWSGSVWPKNQHARYGQSLADVGTNIEVRRVRKPNGSAAVRQHQLGKGLILYVCRPIETDDPTTDLRTVEMFGWIDYDRAWDLADPADYDETGGTRVIARRLLNTDHRLPRLSVGNQRPETAAA